MKEMENEKKEGGKRGNQKAKRKGDKRNVHTYGNDVLEVLWLRLRQCSDYKNSCTKLFSTKLTDTAVYSMAATGNDEMMMKPLKSAFF